MPSSPTRSGTQKLSDVARKVVAPDGIVATGWPAVEATCRQRLGVEFDEWQHGAGRLILAKRADGKLAAMIGGVGMSLPRQVGKTYLIGSMAFALCINHPGLLVIWSAHHARTHGETFLSMQSFADRAKVKPYIGQVFKGSGDEEIRFANGSRILFGARERGFGRGIPGVDMIVSDEAQIMSDKALDAQLATMNTSGFGLAIYVGTPPRPDDPSEAFTRMRAEAWTGALRDAAWIEFGADRDADPTSRTVWRLANPSYPRRTPAESILRLQRKLTPESFLREGLGIWDEATTGGSGITSEKWKACGDATSQIRDVPSIAVDVSPYRWSAIALSGHNDEGMPHVEVPEFRSGTDWVVPRTAEIMRAHGIGRVYLDTTGPTGALLPEFLAAGFQVARPATEKSNDLLVDIVGARDMAQACGLFFNLADDELLRHLCVDDDGEILPDDALNQALAGAQRRPLGDAWAWARKKSTADIAPLVAATLAVRAAQLPPPEIDVSASVW